MGELMARRYIDDISLGPIALGTMRFLDKGLSRKELADLIAYTYHELGINVHHSSYEYNSYELYCSALKELRQDKTLDLVHICKLSSPDFKEQKFSTVKLRNRIVAELKHLGIERIDILQWLYRTEPIDDDIREEGLKDSINEINAAFDSFVREGIIGTVGCFPYSIPFGKLIAEVVPQNKGWITYLNLLEQENLDNLPDNQWLIGIRPLAAGKIAMQFEKISKGMSDAWDGDELKKMESAIRLSLNYCLSDARVKTNIISISSRAHADSLLKITKPQLA
jgi:aryl-alcohol dehydrogenase-like predicted oxidoreductase